MKYAETEKIVGKIVYTKFSNETFSIVVIEKQNGELINAKGYNLPDDKLTYIFIGKTMEEKKYGDTNILIGEKNISFEIYNYNYERISTITTNDLGIAEITLPYGKYTFKQINTTDGYSMVEDFTISIDNTDNELIELKDLKIEVPNTSTNSYLLIEILKFLLTLW